MSRLLDIAGAALLLLLLTPVLLVAGLLVAWDSPGGILFGQERIGRAMRPFRIHKLRTMSVAPGAPDFDPRLTRITRVGRWLRRWKLDELPQLWNVLVGEMSLVGPRPELRRYVERFRSEYEVLLRRRPGLTDPASIAYRHEAELLARAPDPEAAYAETILPDKLRLSLEYAGRRTLLTDLGVLLRTAGSLFG